MWRMLIFLSGFFAITSFAYGANIDLICEGDGSKNLTDSVVSTNPDGSTEVTNYHSGTKPYSAIVKIHLRDKIGEVELPEMMVPRLIVPFKKQKTIWILENIVESEESIMGRVQYELLYSSKIKVDRITGALEVSGYANFFGRCTQYDPAEVKKLF